MPKPVIKRRLVLVVDAQERECHHKSRSCEHLSLLLDTYLCSLFQERVGKLGENTSRCYACLAAEERRELVGYAARTGQALWVTEPSQKFVTTGMSSARWVTKDRKQLVKRAMGATGDRKAFVVVGIWRRKK